MVLVLSAAEVFTPNCTRLLQWKISLHTAAAAGLAMLSVILLGGPALLLTIGIPIVAWARVHIQHHTIAQTVAGALLGLTSVWLWFFVAEQGL